MKTREENFFMSSTPSRVVIRQRLNNGQYLSMRFYRRRTKKLEGFLYCWKASLYIGDKKAADRWNRGKGKDSGKQTGTGSIAGLRLAHSYVLQFVQNFVGPNAELQINFADEKRYRAYRWLLRHPGFTEYISEGKPVCLAYRRPERWVYEPIEDIDEINAREGAGA